MQVTHATFNFATWSVPTSSGAGALCGRSIRDELTFASSLRRLRRPPLFRRERLPGRGWQVSVGARPRFRQSPAGRLTALGAPLLGGPFHQAALNLRARPAVPATRGAVPAPGVLGHAGVPCSARCGTTPARGTLRRDLRLLPEHWIGPTFDAWHADSKKERPPEPVREAPTSPDSTSAITGWSSAGR